MLYPIELRVRGIMSTDSMLFRAALKPAIVVEMEIRGIQLTWQGCSEIDEW